MAEEPLELAQKVSILIFVEFCGENIAWMLVENKIEQTSYSPVTLLTS